MSTRKPRCGASRDLLLVFAVGAFALGGVMASWSLLPETPADRPSSPWTAALAQGAGPELARVESTAATLVADGDRPQPSGCGATMALPTFVATCIWRSDPGLDQRLALEDMAMWQRGFVRERAVGPYRSYVPKRYFALDRARPPATRADGGA